MVNIIVLVNKKYNIFHYLLIWCWYGCCMGYKQM